jgi:hypothetical protein
MNKIIAEEELSDPKTDYPEQENMNADADYSQYDVDEMPSALSN